MNLDSEKIKKYLPNASFMLRLGDYVFKVDKCVLRTYSSLYRTTLDTSIHCKEIDIDEKRFKYKTVDLYLTILYSRAMAEFTGTKNVTIPMTEVEDLLEFSRYTGTELIETMCENKYIEDCKVSKPTLKDMDRFRVLDRRLLICEKYRLEHATMHILVEMSMSYKEEIETSKYNKDTLILLFHVNKEIEKQKDKTLKYLMNKREKKFPAYASKLNLSTVPKKVADSPSFQINKRKLKVYKLEDEREDTEERSAKRMRVLSPEPKLPNTVSPIAGFLALFIPFSS